MGIMMNRSRNQGFTLVELVVVMSVLGIVSLGSVYFIANSVDGYASTQDRESLASRGRYALERITRSLHDALPGSPRANAACIEFIPTVAGTYYLDIPLAAPASQLKAVPPDVAGLNGLRTAVVHSSNAYALTVPGAISDTVTVGAVDVDQEVTINFATPHQFQAGSVGKRLYWVDDPVSYCIDGGQLWRYENYGFNSTQPTPASLPGGLPNRSLLADGVQAVFAVAQASLQRNAVVDIDLSMTEGDVLLDIAASVQVRNAP